MNDSRYAIFVSVNCIFFISINTDSIKKVVLIQLSVL